MSLDMQDYPLVLVFYINVDMPPEIRTVFIENTQSAINNDEDNNIIAFFAPTTGEDRIECVNPKLINGSEHEDIVKTLDDLRDKFGF